MDEAFRYVVMVGIGLAVVFLWHIARQLDAIAELLRGRFESDDDLDE
jgi:hypothetical protein